MRKLSLFVIMTGLFGMCIANGAESDDRNFALTSNSPAQVEIPEDVVRILKGLASLPLGEVNIVKAERKVVLDYIESLAHEGTFKRFLRPIEADTPRYEIKTNVTLRLLDTTYLAAMCQLASNAGLKLGVSRDGTLIVVDANDSLPSTEVYYVKLQTCDTHGRKYEVIPPKEFRLVSPEANK